jgi:hypothetical protein
MGRRDKGICADLLLVDYDNPPSYLHRLEEALVDPSKV